MMSVNLDSELSRLVLRFYFIAILSLDNTHKILWCWKINFYAKTIYFCSWSRERLYATIFRVEGDLHCSEWGTEDGTFFNTGFSSTFPWIAWQYSCGTRRSVQKWAMQGWHHHADWFIFRMLFQCLRYKPKHLLNLFFPPNDQTKGE